MIKVSGTSKVALNMSALEKLMESMTEKEAKGKDLELKLDARGNVKSTFMQIASGSPAKATLYTGAVQALWDEHFTTSDKVTSDLEAVLFLSAFTGVKFLAGVDYKLQVKSMQTARVEDDFTQVRDLMPDILDNYKSLAEEIPDASSSKSTPKSKSKTKTPKNPNASKTLDDVPQAEIPDDLDLLIDLAGSPEAAAGVLKTAYSDGDYDIPNDPCIPWEDTEEYAECERQFQEELHAELGLQDGPPLSEEIVDKIREGHPITPDELRADGQTLLITDEEFLQQQVRTQKCWEEQGHKKAEPVSGAEHLQNSDAQEEVVSAEEAVTEVSDGDAVSPASVLEETSEDTVPEGVSAEDTISEQEAASVEAVDALEDTGLTEEDLLNLV